MIPILTDNARMLSAAFRHLSAAQTESSTVAKQPGATLTLRSWKYDRVYRNAFIVEVGDPVNHDGYEMEMRDVTAMMATSEKLIVQSDSVTWEFKVVDELPPKPRPIRGFC